MVSRQIGRERAADPGDDLLDGIRAQSGALCCKSSSRARSHSSRHQSVATLAVASSVRSLVLWTMYFPGGECG